MLCFKKCFAVAAAVIALSGAVVAVTPAPARAGVVSDLLAVLGLAPAAPPAAPGAPPTDFRNCDTGECD